MSTHDGYSPLEFRNSITRKPLPPSYPHEVQEPVIEQFNLLDKPVLPPQRTSLYTFLRPWIPELISSVLSIGALFALVFTLRAYDGRGIGDLGLPSYLTINGLVALIATINRVTLLGPVVATMSQDKWLWFSKSRSNPRSRLMDFETTDAASRSVWGSFMFLVRGRGGLVTYVGALITIVSLVFGIFAQQMIGIDSYAINLNTPNANIAGHMPRALLYDQYGFGAEPPLDMRAAVYAGIMTSGTIQPPQVSCSTGNCTWPITPSIAICGECVPIQPKRSCDSANCTYTLDDGNTVIIANYTGGGTGVCWNSSVTDVQGVQGNHNVLIDWVVLGLPYESFSETPLSNVTAKRCTLSWCVNAYSRKSISGTQTEQVVASTLEWQQNNKGYEPTKFSNYGSSNITTLPSNFNPTPDEMYAVDADFTVEIEGLLSPLLNGYGACGADSGADETRSSDAADAIWYYTTRDATGWVNNLARSISNAIRTQPPSTYKEIKADASTATANVIYNRYYGTASQLGIRVRWAWIAMPIAVVVASLVILFYEIIATARSDVYPWKASPLALLVTDLEPEIRQQVRAEDMMVYNGLQRRIGGHRATLGLNQSGRLRVSGVDLDQRVP